MYAEISQSIEVSKRHLRLRYRTLHHWKMIYEPGRPIHTSAIDGKNQNLSDVLKERCVGFFLRLCLGFGIIFQIL